MVERKLPKSKSLNRKAIKVEILENIKKSGGLLYISVKKAGIAYDTFLKWRKDDEQFNQDIYKAQEEGSENILDVAEHGLFRSVHENDLKAIMYILNNKGRSRGYVPRIEATGKEGVPLIPANLGEIAKEIVKEVDENN